MSGKGVFITVLAKPGRLKGIQLIFGLLYVFVVGNYFDNLKLNLKK